MPMRDQSASLYSHTGQRKYLNPAERKRFIAAAKKSPPLVRTLCLTLTYTGCRISEALNLTPTDIDQEGGFIAVRSLKKRGQFAIRQIPVPPVLLKELARVHKAASPDLPLWHWGRTAAWRIVKTVMAQARVVHLQATPKGLRHGFGVHAILSGVPVTTVQKWLGHADVSTTAIYTTVLGPEERAIAARMW